MVVWYNLEASCPVCGNRLRLRELGGGFPVGQDSDLLVRMEGKHEVQAAIHTCLRCRFSGYADDFGATLPRPVAQRFLAEVSAKLGGGRGSALASTPLPDVQYYWAYKCAAFLARSDGELAARLLRAYWCLRMSPSAELPAAEAAERRKLYLSGAIHHFRQDSRGKTDPVIYYMLGELNRRGGEFPTAIGYFKRFLDSTAQATTSKPGPSAGSNAAPNVPSRTVPSEPSPNGPPPNISAPKYLRLAAMKLLQAAEHCDSRDRTMEELVYADSPE